MVQRLEFVLVAVVSLVTRGIRFKLHLAQGSKTAKRLKDSPGAHCPCTVCLGDGDGYDKSSAECFEASNRVCTKVVG